MKDINEVNREIEETRKTIAQYQKILEILISQKAVKEFADTQIAMVKGEKHEELPF